MAIAKLVVKIEIMRYLKQKYQVQVTLLSSLRLTPEKSKGIVGPDIDTVSAKRLTSHPAFDTLI